MGQHGGLLTPEERARITELQDLLIDRFVEHREAAADGQKERVRTLGGRNRRSPPPKGGGREVGNRGIGLASRISRLLQPSLVPPIFAAPADPRDLLVRYRRRGVGGRGCRY
jgi:hypothetical protein